MHAEPMSVSIRERHGRRIRVLIVDDVSASREALRRALAFDPAIDVVGEAESGNQAIAQAEELRPDLILMDVKMPDGNGVDATRDIVRRHPNVKVVALTAHDDVATVREMLAAGATGYFLKGAPVDEVLNAVHRGHRGEGSIDHRVLPDAIDELRRLLVQERGRREDVEEIARMRQEFMQVLSHELRTPLTVIAGALRFMERRDLTRAEATLVASALNRGAELERMIEGLELIGEGPADDAGSAANPRDALRDALPRTSRRPDSVVVRDETWPGVRPRHLTRIVLELLSNAFRHGRAPVVVRTYRGGADRILEVTDAGNLDPDSALFDAFAQGDMSSTRERGGLGLGLFVAARLCAADGGRLSIRREGDRTIAEVRYPA